MADEVVIDDQGGGGKRKEPKGEIEKLEKKTQELTWRDLVLKATGKRLREKIEEQRSQEVKLRQRLEELKIEMEQFEEEKKISESISTRAVELEIEVIRIHEDLSS